MICYFKFEIKPVPCTNTHHDVTDLVNHWMVENTKTWTSWEQNRNFLQNKKNLTILRSLTFNKNVSNEFDFLHADKHGSLLQIDTTILMGWSTISKVSKIASLQCLFNISKKKLEKKFTFSLQINIKVSYKLISTLLASNFVSRWYYHWWSWSSILKVFKVTSLQVCNIFTKSPKKSWEWRSFFVHR